MIALTLVEVSLRVLDLDFSVSDTFGRMDADARFGWIYHPNQSMRYCKPRLRPDCASVQTNNQSLREDGETEFEKRPGVRRLLVIGDSQTAGEYVENNETYANVLEGLLNASGVDARYEVLNAGVPAYSPVQEWLWFRDLGQRYRPSVTLVGPYVGNDLLEMIQTGPAPRPTLELASDNSIVLRNYPVVVPSEAGANESREGLEGWKRFVKSLHTYQFMRRILRNSFLVAPLRRIGLMTEDPVWRDVTFPEDRRPRAASVCHGCVMQSLSQSYYFTSFPDEEAVAFLLLEESLRLLAREAAASNTRLLILLIPSKLQVEPETDESLGASEQLLGMTLDDALEFDQRIYQEIQGMTRRLDMEVLDPLPALLEHHEQYEDELLYFNVDWHLSPVGHRVVAEQVYSLLGSEFVIDPATTMALANEEQ